MSKGTAGMIALIMGANSGIGKASSAILADKGYQAVNSCLDEGQG